MGYVYYENGQPNSPFVWALKSPFHIQREFCTSGGMKLECWLFTGTSNCRDLFCNVQFSVLDSMLTGGRIMMYYVFVICLSHHGHHSKLVRKNQYD